MSSCIYGLYEDDGSEGITKKNARYIGKTNDYDERLAEHIAQVSAHRKGKTASLNCERKIASSSKIFMMVKIADVPAEKLAAMEKHYIAYYQTFSGTYGAETAWNETEGG